MPFFVRANEQNVALLTIPCSGSATSLSRHWSKELMAAVHFAFPTFAVLVSTLQVFFFCGPVSAMESLQHLDLD